jgi:hypothetical protein
MILKHPIPERKYQSYLQYEKISSRSLQLHESSFIILKVHGHLDDRKMAPLGSSTFRCWKDIAANKNTLASMVYVRTMCM